MKNSNPVSHTGPGGSCSPYPMPRMVSLSGSFVPDGNPGRDREALMNLWMEAQEQIARNRNRKLTSEEEEWQRFSQAIDKLSPLISAVFGDEKDALAVFEDASELVPDLELRKRVFDWYRELLDQKPEETERERAELEAEKQAQAIRKKLNVSNRTAINAFIRMSKAVETGVPGAAEALLEATNIATAILSMSARRHPELFKTAAASHGHWPVLANTEPGWEKKAAEEISKIELGRNLSKFTTRFRKLRGSDIHLPARRWARAAVRTIDETRWRLPFFVHIVNELGGHDEWAEFAVMRGWDIEKYPSWVSAAMKLKPLSVDTYDDWKVVVREVIREEMRDFHLLPEWAMQRSTAEANGKDTPGGIQNAILDDIVSALKRLAPDAEC